MNTSQGFPQEGGEYLLDPALLNESPWALPSVHEAMQQRQQLQPQQQPQQHSFNAQHTFPQYPISSSAYGNYAGTQETMYPVQSYAGPYAPQYHESTQMNSYGMPVHYPTPTSQSSAPSRQPYGPGLSSFQSYSPYQQESATVSPQDLENTDNNHAHMQRTIRRQVDSPQTSELDWGRNNGAGIQHHELIEAPRGYIPQTSALENVPGYTSTGFGADGPTQMVGPSPQGTDASRTSANKKLKHIQRQPVLRITHPKLLSLTEKVPTRRLSSAPYLVFDENYLDLEITGKTKLPSYKPLKQKLSNISNSEPGAVGSTPTSPATAIKKPRSRPSKVVQPTTVKSTINQSDAIDPKSRVGPQSSSANPGASTEESSSSVFGSSAEEDSEDDVDELTISEEKLGDVREATRPIDVVTAAAWDATTITFVPRNRNARSDEIVKSTLEFERFITNLKTELNLISTELATAEAEKRVEDVKRLKEARALKRKVISSAVEATVKNGHEMVLRYFGNNQKTVNALVTILRDCVKSKDLDGELPKAVLNLLSRCASITDELLQKVKFDALEKRLNAVNDIKIKGYIKAIKANTVEGLERAKLARQDVLKAEKQKAQTTATEVVKARKNEEVSKASSSSLGVKRPLEPDVNGSKPNKKIASETTAVGSSQKVPAAKPRPTLFFDNLKKTSAKASGAAKAALPLAPTKKPEPKVEPVQTPQSSLAAILASIERPREVPKQPEPPQRAPETAEEKAKRERRESRRHLRVRWKDGSALVQVKILENEEAEDYGRVDVMLTRDAHDDRSEGMMLKQRVLDTFADDEDEIAGEVEFQPYRELMNIDFSGISTEVAEKNFFSRGGKIPVNTPQQQIQERRESMELMVVYTDPKDIPPSPKEPPLADFDKPQLVQSIGQPSAQWLIQRQQEIYQYGLDAAMSLFYQRADAQNQNKSRDSHVSAQPDIASILKAMKGFPPQPQQFNENNTGHQHSFSSQQPDAQKIAPSSQQIYNKPPSQPDERLVRMDGTVLAALERIVASKKGKPYPPIEPPDWMTERGKAEWWEGYNRDEAVRRNLAEKRPSHWQDSPSQEPHMMGHSAQPLMQNQHLAQLSNPASANTTAAAAPPYTDQHQNVLTGLHGSDTTAQPDLQSILASLNPAQNSQAAATQQQQAWASAWATAATTAASSQNFPAQISQPQWENGWAAANPVDNNRATYGENSRPTYDAQTQDNSKNRGRAGAYSGDERFRNSADPSDYKRGTKPCKFWQEGKCAKGANCTFIHD